MPGGFLVTARRHAMRFGSGLTLVGRTGDLTEAARTAATGARDELGGARPDLACVFVCGEDSDSIAAAGMAASASLDAAAVIGCSASGVIGHGAGCELEPAVAVW